MIRPLVEDDVALVDAQLPLNRLDQWRAESTTYLVAWDGDAAVGHAHLAWTGTELGLPEIQDVYVLPRRRREGIASALTAACEQLVAERGHDRCSLGVGLDNGAARSLYARLGYADAGLAPKRVVGTIMLRGAPFEVDDTIVYLVKLVAVDSGRPRSSSDRQRPERRLECDTRS